LFPFASVTGTFTKSEVNAEVTAVEGLAVLEILGKFVDPDPYPINCTAEFDEEQPETQLTGELLEV